jgi:hypothetical protein
MQSAGFQADKMGIEDWNAALLEYCSSDFFFFLLASSRDIHHQHNMHEVYGFWNQSYAKIFRQIFFKVYFRIIMGLCVAAATYERRNLCKKWMDPWVM